MNLKSIYLTDTYKAYLAGAEIESAFVSLNEKVEPGQHVMVFQNSPATDLLVTVPADQEAKSIGVEGVITQVNRVTDMKSGRVEQRIRLKKA
ncbi:hypothetical protein [Pseudochryseolinea flava]|uniref:Uncharacterized protein n=1 Tax=Pseudochryseolinea flava TaxID=2059302 RepID=A0A364Y3K5_9BACT|nr:hypothetical protein [Pseudochryseolinea flava]RAW01390.1 hypothetical protein DQQ10_10840 [Pseudochryseolinea flava]